MFSGNTKLYDNGVQFKNYMGTTLVRNTSQATNLYSATAYATNFNYIGNKIARYAVVSLLIFTVIATLLYHLPTDDGQTIHFLKNLSLIGGLLLYYEIL